MHTLPPAHSLIALRQWMRDAGIAALVVQADAAEVQPVAPLRICQHCRLPVGAAGAHGACDESARERSVNQ